MLNISIRMAAIKDGGIKMSLQGKKVLVVGTGKSGIAATELLCANGIDTVLFDGNKELDSKTLYEKAPKLKEVPLILGDLTDEQIDEFDVAVLGGSTTDDIVSVLELFLLDMGFECEFYQSEYGQFWQDAVFSNEGVTAY
mgnify:CR=1 FL=1